MHFNRNSISSSLPQGSHEIARRMRIVSAFRAQIGIYTRFSYPKKIDSFSPFGEFLDLVTVFNR